MDPSPATNREQQGAMPMTENQPSDAIGESHPQLRSTAVACHNRWRELVASDKDIGEWERKYFAGGTVFTQHLQALFATKELLNRGDKVCTALYPVLYYADDLPVATEGAKIKPSTAPMPATIAVVGDVVMIIVEMDRGWVPLLIERTTIAGARWVKVGGLLVTPKYPGLQLEIVEGGARSTELVCFAQLLTERQLQAIRADMSTVQG